MLSVVRKRSGRARRLHLELKRVVNNNADAKTTSAPVGSGAFAALLVEWKLEQRASDTEADRPTLKSA